MKERDIPSRCSFNDEYIIPPSFFRDPDTFLRSRTDYDNRSYLELVVGMIEVCYT